MSKKMRRKAKQAMDKAKKRKEKADKKDKAKKSADKRKAPTKKTREESEEEAEEEDDDQEGEDAEEGAEEEELTDDEVVEVAPKKKTTKAAMKSVTEMTPKKKSQAVTTKEKEQMDLGPQRRFVEPDLDDADEMREKYLKKLLQGNAPEAQCLEVKSGIVTGHVLFQVLDLQRCQEGVIAEVAFLAKKGATPAKAKLTQRGSGILIHLCSESGCKSAPLKTNGLEWLHFNSWRPVKKVETKKDGWQRLQRRSGEVPISLL